MASVFGAVVVVLELGTSCWSQKWNFTNLNQGKLLVARSLFLINSRQWTQAPRMSQFSTVQIPVTMMQFPGCLS